PPRHRPARRDGGPDLPSAAIQCHLHLRSHTAIGGGGAMTGMTLHAGPPAAAAVCVLFGASAATVAARRSAADGTPVRGHVVPVTLWLGLRVVLGVTLVSTLVFGVGPMTHRYTTFAVLSGSMRNTIP